MRIVGLTGGIASGKSTVSNLFKASGIPVVDADVVARNVLKKGSGGWKRVVAAFGEEILLPSREVDRPKLGQMVFSSDSKRQLLNKLMAPYIYSVFPLAARFVPPSVDTMTAYATKIFWNPDSWLPDTYQEPKLVCNAIIRSLVKRRIYYPYASSVWAYADAKKFTDEVAEEYDESNLFDSFETKKGRSDHERLHFMLVDLVLLASADTDRKQTSVIIAKLSQGSEMICRVLGSLRQRDCRVLFALPEVDVATSFGITVSHEQTKCGIPVWLCPDLFNPEGPPQRGSKSYFIEPPPEPYAIDFTMPADVYTGVFWDMQDYPLPPGLGLSTFVMNIRSAVQGHVPLSSGGVKIYAYDGADDHCSPVNVVLKYEDGVFEGITLIRNAPADKFARLAKITLDFCLWSMDNAPDYVRPKPRLNLLVISKPWDDYRSSFQTILGCLTCRGHNVFLALPTDQIPPRESNALKDKVPLLSWELLCATPAADATPSKRRRLSVSY